MCSVANDLNYLSNHVLCCHNHNSKYISVPNNSNYFRISCMICFCAVNTGWKIEVAGEQSEIFFEKSFFMFA